MKITLAYPYDGHEPDDTVELDDDVARSLLRDGLARHPDTHPTNDAPDPGEED